MASSSRPQHNSDNQSIFICSDASSNETADNLPGSGRIIGNCYTFSGRRLERWLNSAAERLGFGPQAVAVRIQRKRKTITTYPDLPLLPGPFKAKSKKIEKDCKKLIGYVRSGTASTRKQALDRITDISFEDSYVRGLFKVLGAVDAIEPMQRDTALWIYYGYSLQNSSRKALVSLTDVEINMVLQKADVEISMFEESDSRWGDTFEKIFAYLYDPDRSFIVVRYFRRLFEKLDDMFHLFIAVNQALDLIRNPPNNFEWEEGDQLLTQLLEYYDNARKNPPCYSNFEDAICDILEVTFRHMKKLPRTTSSEFFQRWLAYYDEAETIDDFLEAHRLIASDGDVNNLYINPDSLQAIYPPAFLLRATCPADIVLCKIANVYTRHRLSSPWTGPCGVLQSAELGLGELCLELARNVNSNDTLFRNRARHCASVVLRIDVYCRAAMIQAFTSTGFTTSSDFAIMAEETTSLPARNPTYYPHYDGNNSFYRHCDADGNLIHICNGGRSRCGRACDVSRVHVLHIRNPSVLMLHVPPEIAFSSVGHYPLLAGHVAGGKPAYIARIQSSGIQSLRIMAQIGGPTHCVIPEGIRPMDLPIVTSSPIFSDFKLEVFVLRHAPAAYAESGCSANAVGRGEGLDATGVFSWKPVLLEDEVRQTFKAYPDDKGFIEECKAVDGHLVKFARSMGVIV